MASDLLEGLPTEAPKAPQQPLRYADIAVTATAKEFAGIYRNKQHHPPDFPAVLDRASLYGVEKVLLTGMSLSDIPTNLTIARSRPTQCHLTVGIHPYHAAEPENDPTYLNTLFSQVHSILHSSPGLLCAYGELGLDYDHLTHASKEFQITTFKLQLDRFIAENLNTRLPLFLHCRAAFPDFISVLTPYLPSLPLRGVVHSFVGPPSQMQSLIALGFSISVNGFSFATRDSLDMVRELPLDKLMIETDAPWGEIKAGSEVARRYLGNARELPQSKKRDKWEEGAVVKERNESCAMERVGMVVAGVKGVELKVVAGAAWENSVRMFGFAVGGDGNGNG